MKQITHNLFVETGYSGSNNSCIITEEGLVLVDTPHKPGDAVFWKTEVEKRGNIRYLINTEYHDDHITGNFFFNAPIIGHEQTREDALALSVQDVLDVAEMKDPDGMKYMQGYRIKAPTITFSERMELHLGDMTLRLIHLPGHTRGQTAVYIPEEGVIFTGDNITYKVQAFMHDAEPMEWLESLEKLKKFDFEFLIPGHGDVCNKEFIDIEKSYITEYIETVKEAINKGWSREETIERVELRQNNPYDAGAEAIGPTFMTLAVARLYDKLR